MNNGGIFFDSSNPKLICKLMELYGDSQYPYLGTNESGEDIELHISKTSVICKTYQSNGWLRANHFDENGYPNCETFEGRWK